MAMANVEIAGARYRSVTFPSLTSLEHMTMCDSSVNENPMPERESVLFIGTQYSNLYTKVDAVVSQPVATALSSCSFRLINFRDDDRVTQQEPIVTDGLTGCAPSPGRSSSWSRLHPS
jgi:hypothetical protein